MKCTFYILFCDVLPIYDVHIGILLGYITVHAVGVLDAPFYRNVDPSKSSISHQKCSKCTRWIIEVTANVTSGACRFSNVLWTHTTVKQSRTARSS